MRPRVAHAIRWGVDEWKRVRARARAEGRTPSDVVRDAVAWYCNLAEGGFDLDETISVADLRAAIDNVKRGRLAAASKPKAGEVRP